MNLYNLVAYQERFMIPLPTFYKPMIEVQMRLYKSDGVIHSCLCYFLVSLEVVYITYTMATRDSPDIYALARGPQARGRGHIYQANPSWPWYNYYII